MCRHTLVILFLAVLWGLSPGASAQAARTGHHGAATLSDGGFRRLFQQYVCSELEIPESDVVISRFRVTGNRRIPGPGDRIRICRKGKRRLMGNVRLTAIITSKGFAVGRVNLSAWVDVFRRVACARRSLKRGDIIREGDLYLTRKNITRFSRDILTDVNSADGLMVRHGVKADTCLKKWMLERSPLVTRGDRVTILAESGVLRITVPGKVMEKGCRGDLVRVRNMMSKKEIFARVVNNLTVRVDF